jgi:hypothetical protein
MKQPSDYGAHLFGFSSPNKPDRYVYADKVNVTPTGDLCFIQMKVLTNEDPKAPAKVEHKLLSVVGQGQWEEIWLVGEDNEPANLKRESLGE